MDQTVLVESFKTKQLNLEKNEPIKKKRNELGIDKKKEILDLLEKKTITRKIADQYGIAKSTVVNISKNRGEILKLWSNNCNSGRKRKIKKTGNYHVNILVLEFFKWCQAHDVTLTRSMLQKKGKEIAQNLGIENFQASNGWLEAFIKRYNINFKTLCNDSTNTDMEQVIEKKIPETVFECNSKTIDEINQTALSLNEILNNTVVENNDSRSAKEEITKAWFLKDKEECPRYKPSFNDNLANTITIKQEDNSTSCNEEIDETRFEDNSSNDEDQKQDATSGSSVPTVKFEWCSEEAERLQETQGRTKETQSLTHEVLSMAQEYFKRPRVVEDRFDIYAKNIAIKLRELTKEQMLIAEKIINDTLFHAQMGKLTYDFKPNNFH